MNVTEREKQRINEIYSALCGQCTRLCQGLTHRLFEVSWGFYNGHAHETKDGGWQMDCYPIPVVSVKGLCDVEISLDEVSVTTKKRREDALAYSFERLGGRSFESFGVEGYLDTFYRDGMTFDEMKASIASSKETEIGFSFPFPWDMDGNGMYEFAKLLRREGFYY